MPDTTQHPIASQEELQRARELLQRNPPDSHAPAAFAALIAIESGDWDRYLIRLQGAIKYRMARHGKR